MSSELILRLDDINAGYSGVRILWDISLGMGTGTITAVIGPNGAGKTTLFNVITGVLKPDSGKVYFMGREITGLPPHRIARLGISGVPEGRRLFPHMSVRDNLLLGTYSGGKIEGKILQERLESIYSLFPILRERSGQKAGSLSGGEQQMLAIARALMSDPKFLVIDEPSIGLAPSIVDVVYNSIGIMKRDMGINILVLEQDIERVNINLDDVYYISQGRISPHRPVE